MSFNIKTGESKTATAVFTDAAGVAHPLPAGNVPAWAVNPAAALTLTPAADGMTCGIVGGVEGDFSLTASVEGDPTPGVDPIVATIAGTVPAPEDTQGTITIS